MDKSKKPNIQSIIKYTKKDIELLDRKLYSTWVNLSTGLLMAINWDHRDVHILIPECWVCLN